VIPLRRAKEVLGRGIRLLCPRCGRAPLFLGLFTMLPACAVCDFRFEREQGYFVGAIYLNYAATALLALSGYFALDALARPSVGQQVALWGAFCVVFPLWWFRYSKSLWLAIDYVLDPEGAPDEGLG